MTKLEKSTIMMTVDLIMRLVTLTGVSINTVLVVSANGTAPLTSPAANRICNS